MKPDPKPTLGPAAIQANLEYYQAQEHKYSNQYRLALEQTTYWLRELEKLKTSTPSDS